jgi:hypothetical protein
MSSKRIWFLSICLLVVSMQAHAQAPTFDPRSWKKAIAGPPTEVMVLGTMHLRELKTKLDPSMLGLLIERLAAFKPTIITIEALSGETCDVLTRYKAVYGEAVDYCHATDDARKATGLDVAAAEAEIITTLGAWPTQPSPGQRRHLAAVFLAANDPNSAVVQWLRLADSERHAGDGIDAPLLATLNEVKDRSNESIQIAATLAARLGLERVFAVDDHTADAIEARMGEDGGKTMQAVWNAPRSKLRQAVDSQRAALKSPADVLAYYRTINRSDVLQDAIQSDFGASLKQQTPQLYGRQYVAWWETRNLRMVANIRATFGNHPGARVLVIVGASHKPYFDAYLDMMHEVKLVDPSLVLK